MNPERAQVVAEARTWLRTPWHHAARVKGAGVDCAQLLIGVYAAAGAIAAFDPPPYGRDWFLHDDRELLLELLEPYVVSVDAGEVLPGDLALFRFGRCVAHAAIVVAWPEIIHVTREHGCILESADPLSAMAPRLVGYRSLRRWHADAGGTDGAL